MKVSVVKVKQESTSLAQLEMLEKVFLFPNGDQGLSSIRTNCGLAVTIDTDRVVGPLTLIAIFDGLYDPCETAIVNYCTLDRIHCDYIPRSSRSPVEILEMQTVVETLQQVDDVIFSIYQVPKTPRGSIQDVVSGLIKALQKLNYLSLLADALGVYSELVKMALKAFQKDFNASNESNIPHLPAEGLLCPDTWRALQARLRDSQKR